MNGTEESATTAPRWRVVYVAGYGRSGSTLLDTLLGNHPQVFGAGELTWLFRDARSNESCTCGEPVRECAFWRNVLERVFRKVPSLDVAEAARISLQTERLLGDRSQLDLYVKLWTATFEAIAAVGGRSIVVDSSKSSRSAHHRLPLLARHLEGDVSVVHLVRDPRGVMWSSQRGSNRLLEIGKSTKRPASMLRGLCSWIYSNTSTELLHWRHARCDRFRLRYEDLVASPAESLQNMGDWLKISLDEVVTRVCEQAPFDPGHGIAGNRMRRSDRIVLRADDEWRMKLPHYAKAMAYMALPLMRRYGYK